MITFPFTFAGENGPHPAAELDDNFQFCAVLALHVPVAAALDGTERMLLVQGGAPVYADTATYAAYIASFGVGTATKLATPHTIGMTGDVTWTSAPFDGTADVTGVATLSGTISAVPSVTSRLLGQQGSGGTKTSTWQAAEMALSNVSGKTARISLPVVTLDLATVGVNGLDNGVAAASTFYYVWGISDGSVGRVIASTSSVAPSPLPGGYTYYSIIGVVKTDGSANVVPFIQQEKDWDYLTVPFPAIDTGSVGAWTAASLAALCPALACRVKGTVYTDNDSHNCAVSHINPGGATGITPPGGYAVAMGGSNGGSTYMSDAFDIPIVSGQLFYYSSGGSNGAYCTGFRLNL